MQEDRRRIGAEGETRAAAHLAARGYRILARNVRVEGAELDLIAEQAGTIVFVEVKTRRSRSAGSPEEAVDARKRARIVRGAVAWLAQARPRRLAIRFDVVACEPDGNGAWRIRHLEAAFDAGD